MNELRSALAVLACAMIGCGGGAAAVGPSGTEGGASAGDAEPSLAPPTTFGEQVALGGEVYGRACASCHGPSGEGGRAPRLVGLAEGALPLEARDGSSRSAQFEAVADVATYTVANMPPGDPGSLDGVEYWAVLAFALHENGIDLEEELTPALAATLRIPRGSSEADAQTEQGH